MKTVRYGSKSFYSNLGIAIENLLGGKTLGSIYNWGLEDTLGFKCWKEGNTVKVKIRKG